MEIHTAFPDLTPLEPKVTLAAWQRVSVGFQLAEVQLEIVETAQGWC